MADTAALVVALSAQLTKFEKDMKQAVAIADTHTKQIENTFTRLNVTINQQISNFASGYAARLGGLGTILQTLGPIGLTVAAGLGGIGLSFDFFRREAGEYILKKKEFRETAETTGLTLDQLDALGRSGK